MTKDWFAGDKVGQRKFARYLPSNGPATRPQFTFSRRIINGIDKAEMIAGYAMAFQAALTAGGLALAPSR